MKQPRTKHTRYMTWAIASGFMEGWIPSLKVLTTYLNEEMVKLQQLEQELAKSGKKNLSNETVKEINMNKFKFDKLTDEQFNTLKENVVGLNKAILEEIKRRGSK